MSNNSKPSADGGGNGTAEIANKSVRSTCKDTTPKKKWIRLCPKCHKEIHYKSQTQSRLADSNGSVCKTCSRTHVIITNGSIRCKGCKVDKSVSEFHKRSAVKCGYDSFCKVCRNEIVRESDRNNPEKVKSEHLRHKYGIDLDKYKQMLLSQNNVCAICHKPETRKLYNNPNKCFSLMVDHSHSTHQIRGLLCHKCNSAIGMLNDDMKILQSAIDYLSHCSGE